MTKHETPFGKHPAESVLHKGKIVFYKSLWKSMINWLIVLVVILPILYSAKTVDPNVVIRYVFLSLFVLLFLVFFFSLQKSKASFSFSPLIIAVFALGIGYALWGVVCMHFAINIPAAYYEIARHLLNMVVLFIVMLTVKHEESQLLKLCKALAIVSLIQSVVGIFQFFEIAFLDIPGAFNPYGLMGNRNLFGSAQVLLLPFSIFVLYRSKGGWKYVGVFAVIALLVSVVISQTRSAWLATMALTAMAMILIFIFVPLNRKKWITGALITMALIAAIITVLLTTTKNNSFLESVRERTFTLFHGREYRNPQLNGRMEIWQKSMDLVKDHRLFGVSPGNWNVAIMPYGTDGWADGIRVPSWPHNVYIQVASETGIPGTVLYFGMWIFIAIMAIITIRRSRSEDIRVLAILVLAGLAAFATDCLFSYPTARIEHSLYIMLMGGIILGCYSNLPEKRKQKIVSKGLTLASLAIAIFNLFLGYKKYNLELHMNLAKAYQEKKLYRDVIQQVEAGKTKFVTLDPNGDPLELLSAAAYADWGNYTKALEEITIAKSYHPYNARILTTMGAIYAGLKQYDSAVNYNQYALQLTSRNETAIKNLADVYFKSGDYAACIKILTTAYYKNTPYLTNLLNEAQRKVNGQ